MGDDALKVIVRRVAGIHAIGPTGERKVIKPPVVGVLNVEDAPVVVREGTAQLQGLGHVDAVDGDLFALVGRHDVGGAGRAALPDLHVHLGRVGAAPEVDGVAGGGQVDGLLDVAEGGFEGAMAGAGWGDVNVSREDDGGDGREEEFNDDAHRCRIGCPSLRF